MVNPILLVAVPLGVGFLLPLFGKLGRPVAVAVHGATILFTTAVAALWLPGLIDGSTAPLDITTGGWSAPIGITLRFGLPEAVLCVLAGLTALASLAALTPREDAETVGRSGLLQLLVLTGAFGLIMTRDLFNLYVFLEISSIGTYAIVAFGRDDSALEAGFKYMLIGAAASTFLLVAIAYLYKLTGTLSLVNMPGLVHTAPAGALAIVMLFLLAGMAIELKLIPVNGPALDLYDGAEPGVMALLTGATVNGVLFAFWKVSALFPQAWYPVLMTMGMITFTGGNLMATMQDRPRRMLGYSSSAQLGLLVFLVPLVRTGAVPMLAAGLLLINHTLAKSALLWLAGVIPGKTLDDWTGAFRSGFGGRVLLAAGILAITGLPPFPGFWGKWTVVTSLAHAGMNGWITALLLGSLFEFIYYYRWYQRVQTEDDSRTAARPVAGLWDLFGPALFGLGGLVLGLVWTVRMTGTPTEAVIVIAAVGLVLLLVKNLPALVLNLAGLLGVVAAALWLGRTGALAPDTLPGLFQLLILGGGALVLLAGLSGGSGASGSVPGLFMILVSSLLMLARAETLLQFFAGWEIMTWSSYLIIGHGRRGPKPASIYMVFSGAAGFLVLGGMMAAIGAGQTTLAGLGMLTGSAAVWAWTLLGLGFLVKSAAVGAHVWAPGAYSESPDLFTPFLSGVISKIPMFGFMVAALRIAAGNLALVTDGLDPLWLLGAVGAVTAFGMTLLAVFQEDAKKLLAYSSVGQVGYIVVGLAILSPLGWTAALFHVVHHLLFKGLLFFAIAGVIMRTGTRTMYEMGGLIKKMPLSFISTLIGIIALSGVPPLAGFTGKWLLYQALLAKGWYFILVLVMFASVVAFVYLFRLIHTVFLGQLKPQHRTVREVPLPLAVTQVLMIIGTMALAVYPQVLLRPLDALVRGQFQAAALTFDGTALVTATGATFNPTHMMVLVVILFVLMALGLLVLGPWPRKVGQLDIGFAGELPPPPQELHYAANFAQPYRRAWAHLVQPRVMRFWNAVADGGGGAVDLLRRMYSGNGQTYVMYAVLLVAVLALLGPGR